MREFLEAIEQHKDAACGVAVFIIIAIWAIGDAISKRKEK